MNPLGSKIWQANERSGLTPIQDSLEYLITVPLYPGAREDERQFDLYYFVHTSAGQPTFKSVLFCAGGPGQIVRTFDRSKTYVDYLAKNGYNVVFFHLRGTGFSQIPPSTKNDRFLKCQYAIHDMEAIRCHFHEIVMGGKDVKWEAVIGWSFGTVLAQLYAHSFEQSVKKLVLVSPLSRHRFNESKKAFEEYYWEMLGIYRATLNEIYTSGIETLQNEFGDMTEDEIRDILNQLFGIKDGVLKKTEEAFGSIQVVVESYSKMPEENFPDHKKYSLDFYQSLRDLRVCGANSVDDTGGIYERQRLIGKILRDEMLARNTQDRDKHSAGKDSVNSVGRSQNSHRAYYSFGVNDGLNWVFLNEYQESKDVKKAVRAMGGATQITSEETQGLNGWLEKIEPNGVVEPWDPKRYWHKVPTLILNGGADPVTAARQAQRYYHPDPPGATTLIVFPGIGHNISLGGTGVEKSQKFEATPPILNGAIHIVPPEIPPGEVREVTGIAKGWRIDPSLKITLKEPESLHQVINIEGCGILGGWGQGNAEIKSGSVVALIKNTTKNDVTIDGSEWTIETSLFSGKARFMSSDLIPKDKTKLIYGTLIHGERKESTEYHVKPKTMLDPRLKLVGYTLKPPASVELWIQNHSDLDVNQDTGDWIITSEKFERIFKVNLPEIKAHETKSVVWGVDGLSISINEALTVERPNDVPSKLVACLQPQKEGSKGLSLTVWNQDPNQSHRVAQSKWTIKSAAFSVTVVLEPFEVGPGAVTTVQGDVSGMQWAKCLDFKPANYPDPPIELVCYNIISENQVSMLLRNPSRESIKGKPRDWIYVLPTSDANLVDLNQALNALIFSFLVLEPAHFYKREENEILHRILSKFELANLTVIIEPEPPAIGNAQPQT